MNRQLLITGETEQMGPRGAPMTDIQIPVYWTVAQVAKLLAVKTSTLRTWMRRGQSPPYLKIGDTVRFDPRAVTFWLEQKTISDQPRRVDSAVSGEDEHSRTSAGEGRTGAEGGDA